MNSFANPYVVSVKKAAGFSQYKQARLQVSVGGANHEGDKLGAMLTWMQQRFDHVTICVNDTLQRHNLCFDKGLPDSMAMQITRNYGDQWIARHSAFIAAMPSVALHRWDDWLKHPDYAALHADILKLYAEQDDMRRAVDATVQDFWERRCKRIGVVEDFKLPSFQKHSRAYVLEETAIFTLMFREPAADIYPGSINLPFAETEKYLPHAAPAGYGSKIFTHLSLVRRASNQQTG